MKSIVTAATGLLLSLSPQAFATPLPVSKEEFCSRYDDPSTLLDYAQDADNLIMFRNHGGLFNGGVCWWHSRFQRNAFYLAVLRPDLPRPEALHIPALIRELRWGKSVVNIPGFSHFHDFTQAYQKEIMKELEAWQIYDGVLMARWIDGLKGESSIAPQLLKKMLDELYKYVEVEKKIAYVKLQIKGITAHAWLINGIKPSADGYDLNFIDSNNPLVNEVYSYRIGDDSFYLKLYGHFVPYLEFKREELALHGVSRQFCQKAPRKREGLEQKEKLREDLQKDVQEAALER